MSTADHTEPLATAEDKGTIDQFMLSAFENFKELTHKHNLQTTDVPVGLERPFGRGDGSNYAVRFVVKTDYWAISAVCTRLVAEFYLIPAVEMLDLLRCETVSRRKMAVTLQRSEHGAVTLVDNQIASPADLKLLNHGLLKDLINKSLADKRVGQGTAMPSMSNSITGAIRDLLVQRGELLHSLVTEGEEVRSEIAREIHDEVINDLLYLRRTLQGDDELVREMIVSSLDSSVLKLRQVCYDLAPRDLRDWGLPVVLKDLIGRLQTRIPAECVFDCVPELPRLEHDVELQIYRIVQECLNNIEKHSQSTAVRVSARIQDDESLRFSISDNGIGYEAQSQKPSKGSNQGSSIIRERTELIALHHPVELTVKSAPGSGTEVVLLLRWRKDSLKPEH